MRRIFIFRHGETDWNREGRFQGQLDIPLNELGREQAARLAAPLRENGIEAILSSDLGRAYETARIVAKQLGIPVFVDSGLREAHLGGAQGLTKEEIKSLYGKELIKKWKSFQLSDADVSYPDGESGSAVMQRVFAAMERFSIEMPYRRFGIACHGGVIRRVMQKILPPGSEAVPIPNGIVYPLTFDPASDPNWKAELPAAPSEMYSLSTEGKSES